MNHEDEIKAVKDLGEKIGYGNIMNIASALWDRDLHNATGADFHLNGCFVPTLPQFIKEEFLNMVSDEHLKELRCVVKTLGS